MFCPGKNSVRPNSLNLQRSPVSGRAQPRIGAAHTLRSGETLTGRTEQWNHTMARAPFFLPDEIAALPFLFHRDSLPHANGIATNLFPSPLSATKFIYEYNHPKKHHLPLVQ